ncbi:hypothetical protein F4802DRAFT_619919 [Xylaria palmicola]|nr:hypothetical protein F4802DRAFT_619919 [Xylaria palmicola]
MSVKDHRARLRLAEWYEGLHPRKIDIVGDFGGKQRFLIDGDSLLLHSVAASAVDLDGGFQLLHAVFAVELFLKRLRARGCDFQVVFFDNQRESCAPPTSPANTRYKWEMTRAILIKHLRQPSQSTCGKGTTGLVFIFPSIDSPCFHNHLAKHPATFLLCHDGHTSARKHSPHQAAFQYMIHQFLRMGSSVALIDNTEFKSSRVIMPMITAAHKILSLRPSQDFWPTENVTISEAPMQLDWAIYKGSSYRELLTAAALCRVLRNECIDEYKIMAVAMILHSMIITHTRVTERSLAELQPASDAIARQHVTTFLERFCQEITSLVSSDLGDSSARRLSWDVFDIIDGRLFLSLNATLSTRKPIPAALINKAKPLLICVETWSGISLLNSNYLQVLEESGAVEPKEKPIAPYCDSSQAGVLSFDHEVLNEFLAPVQLQTTQLSEDIEEGKIFQELTHWHNARRALDLKKRQGKPGFYAMKRTQRFMADTLVYSASLTNAAGKLVEPQTIVVASACASKNTLRNHTPSGRSTEAAKPEKKNKRGKSGRDNAREAALLTQFQKRERINNATFQHWLVVAREISQEPRLTRRFQKANKHFLSLAKEHKEIIGAEVSLYLCDILYCAWEEQAAATSGPQALGTGSLLFHQAMKTLMLPGLTEEIIAVLQKLSSTVGIPSEIVFNIQVNSRPLNFEPRIYYTMQRTALSNQPREFELGHCGPFLERSFDSRKDDRVPFDPDAWQQDVLNRIDANDSLFIVAPTSSGKTFISFYAMEKVLRTDDDGVLVYVAPTKALVNQIAAEIQARFQKTYHHEGKSVWAIHTRDYRVNNATGCQILVTVPHVLQIMLLAPSNATGSNPWSKRVKRIIFDEVHCIGQADDGVIWEQLLLMAPCPIIALSATVGNPEEFYEWLRLSQESKGFKLRMITHNTRYSDLRAFQYLPPVDFQFQGLDRTDHFPIPGLDRPSQTSSRFQFIHPIAATGAELGEVSLEPRDALTLWEAMNKSQAPNFQVESSLDPSKYFSGVPRKSDVLEWTRKLKDILVIWMQDPNSPFDKVRHRLDIQGRPTSSSEDEKRPNYKPWDSNRPTLRNGRLSVFALLCDLHREDGLPAILFNYDRVECEQVLEFVLKELESAERKWKESSREWQKEIKEYSLWKASEDKIKIPKKTSEKQTKDEKMREQANVNVSRWESFDPNRPLAKFSFADSSRLVPSELNGFIDMLKEENIRPHLISALKRGLAVHHSGMNRRYRQVVEILFRKGFLTAVVATGTLALGINMPCKTVAFIGDSTFLTPLNYRQGAGRAGRRGFDLLGNVVFCNMSRHRAYELITSRLPDLKGHFPLTTTLVLRILGLIETAGQSNFTSGMVKSLMTQSRLYLGGEGAGMSIQHHLRFSVEYLQRQRLLSADGKPLNFAGLVGHLYFTENAVFAFHSLLKGGYFHRLCSHIDPEDTEKLRTLGLVMAHLFNRIHTRNSGPEASDLRSISLPRLPPDAESLLISHNNETLEIFKTYASTFVDQYLEGVADRHLPFTGLPAGGENPRILRLPGDLPPTKLRSPFSALSGHTDDFKSIRELCADIRSGVFLEESAVPHIPIWPHDLARPLNSYIYDFLKHGDYAALTRDNGIKKGDVWFLLKDFSLVLATVVASLTNFIRADDAAVDDMIGLEDDGAETPEDAVVRESEPPPRGVERGAVRPNLRKKKVVESWDDDDEDEEDGNGYNSERTSTTPNRAEGNSTPATGVPPLSGGDGHGLVDVLKAFTLLKQDFDEKFRKAWA